MRDFRGAGVGREQRNNLPSFNCKAGSLFSHIGWQRYEYKELNFKILSELHFSPVLVYTEERENTTKKLNYVLYLPHKAFDIVIKHQKVIRQFFIATEEDGGYQNSKLCYLFLVELLSCLHIFPHISMN